MRPTFMAGGGLAPRMRPAMAALAAASAWALLAAGCLGEDAVPAAGDPVPSDLAAGPVAHRGEAFVAPPAGAGDLAADVFGTGYRRGEPTVGLTSDGILFATGANELPSLPGQSPPGTQGGIVVRSLDGGRTWDAVQDVARNGKADLDPWVWVDPATDRVYSAPLYAACSWSVWSDDRGQTWDANPLAGCGLPAHDHQKLTGGPSPQGVATAGYPSVLYYAYNSLRNDGGTFASVSLDGGATYGLPVEVHPSDPCQGGINGPVAVAPDGRAYLPKPTCDGPAIAWSDDAGATWSEPVVVRGAGMGARLVTLHAAVDAAGTAYVLWTGADERLYLSHSPDGSAWSAPAVASAPGLRSVVFSALAAGGAGRIGLGYVATTSDPSGWPAMDPSVAPDDTVWHAYLAVATDADAGGAGPTFTAVRLTTDADPVQRGCVWLAGGANACRNLRDFVDVQQAGGRLAFAYADGCDRCASAGERLPLGETVVAVQRAGPSLQGGALAGPLEARALPLPPPPVPPAPSPAQAPAPPALLGDGPSLLEPSRAA